MKHHIHVPHVNMFQIYSYAIGQYCTIVLHAVHSEANNRRIHIVEQCFGSSGMVGDIFSVARKLSLDYKLVSSIVPGMHVHAFNSCYSLVIITECCSWIHVKQVWGENS